MFLLTICLLAIGISLTVFLLKYTLVRLVNLAARRLEETVRENLAAMNEIVEHDRLPEAWLHTYRQQMGALIAAGAADNEKARLERRARRYALRRLDALLRFMERRATFDGPESATFVLQALDAARRCWASADWQLLLTAPPLTPLADPQENAAKPNTIK